MSLIPRDSLFKFDNMFENLFSPNRALLEGGEGFHTPRIDIRENDSNYELSAELPGVKKEDLKVTLENGLLTIEAESHQETSEKQGNVVRQERRYGKFERSFKLDGNVLEKDIDASFKDGVLMLTLPKIEPQTPETKKIEIH